MADIDAYLKVKGAKSGDVKGGAVTKGASKYNGWSRVRGVHWDVISPRDAHSGLPSGKRQHHPLVITKRADPASLVFAMMLSTNENATSVELDICRDDAGLSKVYMNYKLTNATVSAYNTFSAPDTGHMMETVQFSYQKIEMNYYGSKEDGTIDSAAVTYVDDWETSN
jgi:type VI secretion system secreted protein Hcp